MKVIIYFLFIMLLNSCGVSNVNYFGKKIPVNIFDEQTKKIKPIVEFEQGDIKKILGEPSLMKNIENSQIWQYIGTECVLNIIWFTDASNATTISTLAYNSNNKKNIDPHRCYLLLLKENKII